MKPGNIANYKRSDREPTKKENKSRKNINIKQQLWRQGQIHHCQCYLTIIEIVKLSIHFGQQPTLRKQT